jgi:hypothetical protein
VERVFHIFDKDDNGSISLQEFIDAMHQFAGQSPDDKIKFLFKVYDIDGETDIVKQTEVGFSQSGAKPKTSSYNASIVKIYNATSSLVRFENKNISFYF